MHNSYSFVRDDITVHVFYSATKRADAKYATNKRVRSLTSKHERLGTIAGYSHSALVVRWDDTDRLAQARRKDVALID